MKDDKKHWVFILTHIPTGLFLVGVTANPNVQFASIKKHLSKGTYPDLRLQEVYKKPEDLEFGLTFNGTEKKANVEKHTTLLSCKDDEKCLNHPPIAKGGAIPASHPLFNQHMNKFEGTSCVYVLKNTETGYFYIGSTQSISTRTKTHLRELRDGTHHCYKLQQSYTGLHVIEFGVFPAGTVPQARKLEQKMLDQYHGTKKCLNSSNSAYSNYNDVPDEWKYRYYKGYMRKGSPEAKAKARFKPTRSKFKSMEPTLGAKSKYGNRLIGRTGLENRCIQPLLHGK